VPAGGHWQAALAPVDFYLQGAGPDIYIKMCT